MPGSEIWTVCWTGGCGRFWYSGVTLKKPSLGKMSMAVMFKVGKKGKSTRQQTPVIVGGWGPKPSYCSELFLPNTQKYTVEIILLAADPVLLCNVFCYFFNFPFCFPS